LEGCTIEISNPISSISMSIIVLSKLGPNASGLDVATTILSSMFGMVDSKIGAKPNVIIPPSPPQKKGETQN
jgi:hypothetical protein